MVELPNPFRDPKLPGLPHRAHALLASKKPAKNYQYYQYHMPTDPKKPAKKHQHHIYIPPDPKKPAKNHHHHHHRHDYHRSCCLGALLFLFLLFTFLAVTGGIIYAWVHPHAPEFHIGRLNVTTLSVATRNNKTYLTSSVDVTLEARNPNDEIRLGYDRPLVAVYAGDGVRLGRALTPAFEQVEHGTTVVRVRAGVSGAAVSAIAGRELVQRYEEGKVDVDVEVDCMVDGLMGDWHTGSFPITAVCSKVDLSTVASGFQPKCRVYLYGWIRLS